jgi:hypothetical protein
MVLFRWTIVLSHHAIMIQVCIASALVLTIFAIPLKSGF